MFTDIPKQTYFGFFDYLLTHENPSYFSFNEENIKLWDMSMPFCWHLLNYYTIFKQEAKNLKTKKIVSLV